MKRDMDLIRNILFEIEKNDNGGGEAKRLEIPGCDERVLYGHLKMLDEAKLIEGSELPGRHYLPGRITWQGHDFLDSVRDENIWKKTLNSLTKVSGSASLDIVKALAISFAQQQLGLAS